MRITNDTLMVHTLKMYDNDGTEIDLLKLNVTSVTVKASAVEGCMVATIEMIPDQIDFTIDEENASRIISRYARA